MDEIVKLLMEHKVSNFTRCDLCDRTFRSPEEHAWHVASLLMLRAEYQSEKQGSDDFLTWVHEEAKRADQMLSGLSEDVQPEWYRRHKKGM